MRFTETFVVLATLAAMAACGNERVLAPTTRVPNVPSFIVNGTYTGARYPSVGALRFDGRRYVSQSEFMSLHQNWLGLQMNTSATGLGGDCYGDSGGPKFLTTNPGVVYATVTSGDNVCRATSWDYRTDTESARAFLGRFVTLPRRRLPL